MTVPLLKTSLDYTKAGLSVIPVNVDKMPALLTWTPYQKKIAEASKVQEWFKDGNQLAVIGGKVSGNFEIIDFDYMNATTGFLEEWTKNVEDIQPGLVDSLLMETSPHGVHFAYRCREIAIPGNTKLAERSIEVPGPGEHLYGHKKHEAKKINDQWSIVVTHIETRGEGGYCVCSPSKGYKLKQGSFTDIPLISKTERAILIDAARSCNQYIKPAQIQKGYQETKSGDLLPGQDFDQRADIRIILKKHGWTFRGTGNDGRERWGRPGKIKGFSATITDNKILFVFSSNADPFEPGQAYSPFAVYAFLEHGGDFQAAARALSGQGYGTPIKQEKTSQGRDSAPGMADTKEYIDLCISPGQKFTVDEVCKGLGCYKLDDRKNIYVYIGRLEKKGFIKKDPYKYAGYRRAVKRQAIDLMQVEGENLPYNTILPLELHNLITLRAKQVLQISGRYDAGKTSFVFQVVADNYQNHKIVLIVSDELSAEEIKDRFIRHGIPLNHPNIEIYPLEPGYEELIPKEKSITLVDYVRANENPYETDCQIQRILHNLGEGVCIFNTQKHPDSDKPVSGQFAVHACHHIVMLDVWNDNFICKIFRSKSENNLAGYLRVFNYDRKTRRLNPLMDNWKKGEIRWNRESNKSNKKAVRVQGGPRIFKEREKKSTKEKEKESLNATIENDNQLPAQAGDLLFI